MRRAGLLRSTSSKSSSPERQGVRVTWVERSETQESITGASHYPEPGFRVAQSWLPTAEQSYDRTRPLPLERTGDARHRACQEILRRHARLDLRIDADGRRRRLRDCECRW